MASKRVKDPDGIDKYVGSRVRMRRLMLGMSQEKLADAIGLTFQQVQKYEKGTNRMGASRLQQIANVLEVPPTYFFDGSPGQSRTHHNSMPDFMPDFTSTSDGLALARAFLRLPKTLRRSVVHLVEEMAGNA
jgi:transcriptional regulator with XRE-family HTH domain